MPEQPWVSRPWPPPPHAASADEGESTESLLTRVARGDEAAFAEVYDTVIGTVWGVVRRVVRDRAQSEEVTQETLLAVWSTASRFDPQQGSALAWVTTMAHRRAVDRVRSEDAATRRNIADSDRSTYRPYDEVSEQADARLERQQVRRCIKRLTELQRESVTLAFYRGYTHTELAKLLEVPLGTIKTRMRDGLIRLRDCLGVGR